MSNLKCFDFFRQIATFVLISLIDPDNFHDKNVKIFDFSVKSEHLFRFHLLIEGFSQEFLSFIVLVALAAAVPKLDLFISLVGSVSSSTLALMAPTIIDTVTFWPQMGKLKWRLWRNVFLFTIGFLGFLTGSFVSIKNIIDYFQS